MVLHQQLAVAVEAFDLGLRFFDGRDERRQVFLHQISGYHMGRETLGERLNSEKDRFLPCQSEDGLELVNLDQVALVECAPELPDLEELEVVGISRAPVCIELAEGETLRGVLSYHRPAESSRLSDLLNGPGDRFLMLRSGEQAWYINRNAVVRVREGGRPCQ